MADRRHRRPGRWSWSVIGGAGLVAVATLSAVLLTPRSQPPAATNVAVIDPAAVTIGTPDGVQLAATQKSPVRNSLSPAIIFLHEYGQDRHQWDSSLAIFVEAGFVVLSYDMRGFGDSRIATIPANTDEHLKSLPEDVSAVLAYLKQQPSIDQQRISLIGAGVGADVAYVASGSQLGLFKTVLLSPSLLPGVLDGTSVTNFSPSNILGVAGTTDMKDLQTVMAKVGGVHESYEVDGGSHGVSLISNAATRNHILEWLQA